MAFKPPSKMKLRDHLSCTLLGTILAVASPSEITSSDLEFRVTNLRQFTIQPSIKKPRHIIRYEPYVKKAAEAHNIHPSHIYAIIHTESSGNPKAVSPAGAVGLMQLMPITQRHLGLTREDAFDPESSIMGGIRYYSDLLSRFQGNEFLALAAYNMGPTKVNRLLKKRNLEPSEVTYEVLINNLNRETREYIAKVLSRREGYL